NHESFIIDLPQALDQDPIRPVERPRDLRGAPRVRRTDLPDRSAHLVARPGGELLEEVLEPAKVVLRQVVEIEAAEQPLHLRLALPGQTGDIETVCIEMRWRRWGLVAADGQPGHGTARRGGVELLGLDLDVFREQS